MSEDSKNDSPNGLIPVEQGLSLSLKILSFMVDDPIIIVLLIMIAVILFAKAHRFFLHLYRNLEAPMTIQTGVQTTLESSPLNPGAQRH